MRLKEKSIPLIIRCLSQFRNFAIGYVITYLDVFVIWAFGVDGNTFCFIAFIELGITIKF